MTDPGLKSIIGSPDYKPLLGAYVARLNLNDPHHLGVAQKIRAQVNALSELPAVVKLYSPEAELVWRDDDVIRRYPRGALWRKLNYAFLFYGVLVNQIQNLDFVYFRYQRSSPAFLWMLSRLKKKNPGLFVCVEIPTYPYEAESISLRYKILAWGDWVSRSFLRRYVDRIVTFSTVREIFGVSTIRISNGVDAQSLQPLPKPQALLPFRLLGLANLAFWHGYDRVIAGIASYKANGGKREIVFDIVGIGNELARLKGDALRAGLEAEVRFHGSLTGEKLTAVMTGAHVGVACIGMHRVDKDTSDLKSREFCARGLPFLSGYCDRDFSANLPFVLQVPATDDPIDIEAVLHFYDRLKANCPNYPLDMHDFAQQNLTWQVKMAPVSRAIFEAINRER
jgi:hypothetical protein